MEKNEQKIQVGDIVRIKSIHSILYTAGESCHTTQRRIYGHDKEGVLTSYEVDEGILVKVQ